MTDPERMDKNHLLTSCAVLLPQGSPPDWIQLMPLGDVNASDGRRWALADARKVVAASAPAGVDLVVDYEHQTEFVEKTGQKAPAAGWIKQIEARADGIWGRVEWTDAAANHIRGREYRYISPTFLATKAGEVVKILRAALTNNPALELMALASAQHEEPMNEFLKKLAKACGLPETATEAEVLSKITAMAEAGAQQHATAVKAIATAAGVAKDSTPEDLAKTITSIFKAVAAAAGLPDDTKPGDLAKCVAQALATKTGNPDPSKFVAADQFNQVSTQLKSIQDDRAAEKAASAVDKAMAEGKIAPASKDWAVAYAKQDPKGFETYVASAPVIVKPASAGPTGQPPKKGGALDDTEKAVAAAMGLKLDDFKKTRDQEEAA